MLFTGYKQCYEISVHTSNSTSSFLYFEYYFIDHKPNFYIEHITTVLKLPYLPNITEG